MGGHRLLLGEAVSRPLLAAYEIAKPLAKLDAGARSKLAPAIDFSAAPAARAAKSPAETSATRKRERAARSVGLVRLSRFGGASVTERFPGPRVKDRKQLWESGADRAL